MKKCFDYWRGHFSDEDIAMLTKHITEDIISRNKIVKALDGDKKLVLKIDLFIIIFHWTVKFFQYYKAAERQKKKF